ncbi:phage tail tape measure protein [Rhodobacter capsulatus]|uniref:phage tail tape measure protein n=1 Tax=Rhodobacter capsulatus TaxID=1061 RepID=UPI0003D3515B|nr:phage tail tape measure protein [Rhodobacter capsulatus]ETD86683.1 tail protein [Rhodobacter capsulatus B6]
MTDMVAAFEIRAKADQAKAEMSQVRGEIEKTGTAAEQASTKGKQLGPALVEPLRNLSPALAPVAPGIRQIGEELDNLPPKVLPLQQEFGNLGTAAGTAGTNVSYMAKQLAFQFSQVLQMGQATGNYVQALAIQIPDMAMGFGTLGIAVGAVAGVSLPLLVNMFTGASTGGKELEKTVSETNEAFDAYARYAEIAAMQTLELKEKFHGFASEVQGFAGYMKGLETSKALDGLSDSIDPLKGQLLGIQQTFAELTKAQAALENAQSNPMASSEQVLLYADNVRMLQEEADAAAAKLGMSAEEARQLADAMDDVGASTSFVDMAASASTALAIIQQIYPSAEDVPVPLRDAVAALADMQRRAAEASDSLTVAQTMGDALMTALDSAAGAASMLGASVPGAGWLDGAISGASRLASQLWDAAKARAAATDTAAPMSDDRREAIVDNRRGVHDGTGYTRDRLRAEARRGAAGGGGGGGSVDRDSFDALTKSAQDALAAMDLAIAAIHEKVALGLMSTAEGEEAISRAKDRAAASIAELIPKMQAANDVSGDQAAKAVEKWRLEVRGLADDYDDVNDKISESAKKAAQSSLYDWIRSAKGGKDAISDFGQHVLDTFARIASQRIADAVFTPIIDSLVGAVFGPTAVAANAKGGVYSGAGISAYSGTIVDRPTLFAFAKGTGLMGEAGPEAILPLDRDSTGKLGVRASGGAGAPVTVNVYNNAPGTKATTVERQEGGARIIDVMIDQIRGVIAEDIATGRGPLPAVMAGTYGLGRVGR